MTQTPLLILSDAITSSTGLARIARDLSTRIHANMQDHFRVGVLGVGGSISTSSRFPFPNYSIRQLEQMCPIDLPAVWQDFAGTYGDGRQEDSPEDLMYRVGQLRKGTLLTIWNCSWTDWLARPQLLPDNHPVRDFLLQRPQSIPASTWSTCTPSLRASLADRPFQRWLYCPVDGHCTDGTLGHQMAPILEGFDRVLAYAEHGSRVIQDTLAKWGTGSKPVTTIPHLPHGIDHTVFYPRDRALARQTLVSRLSNGDKTLPLKPDQILLGAIGTNTLRKDWSLAFQTCAELLARGLNVFLWGHLDTLVAHWNIPAMARQYGMEKRIMATTDRLSDDDLCWAMSACDVGLHIGAGEGFGYIGPQFLTCGVPAIHGNYASGAEFVPSCSLVDPVAYWTEGGFMIQRPVFRPKDWANAVEEMLKPENRETALTPPQDLDWQQVWPAWYQWLRAGSAAGQSASQPTLQLVQQDSEAR